jgi:hypothetical protein
MFLSPNARSQEVEMSIEEKAVIQAADRWVSAVAAVANADEHRDGRQETQCALDTAETELYAAVLAWRSG